MPTSPSPLTDADIAVGGIYRCHVAGQLLEVMVIAREPWTSGSTVTRWILKRVDTGTKLVRPRTALELRRTESEEA